MARAEILIPFVKSWEGGFSNRKSDRGGATMQGVTLATFREVFGQDKTVADLKNITEEQWLAVFRGRYFDKWKARDIMDQSIANLLVDWYWHSGSYGIRIPQYALGAAQDGIVGPKTLAKINLHPDQHALFDYLWKQRRDYLTRIARGSQKRYLQGWLNRLDGIRYKSLRCNGGQVITF